MFDVVGLFEGQLQFSQQYKEEEISDSEFIESSCDEENEDQTSYPSESAIGEWKQRKEMKSGCNKSLKEGQCLPQLINLYIV